ncbi:MAG: hypothetical protein F6K19_22960 [Cyanothece sp. SIO1E1]|nr:hypothetical protein [Cyanothece sp. SIO1E1]
MLKRRKLLTSTLWMWLFFIPVSAWAGSQHQRRASAQTHQKQQITLIKGVPVPAQFQIEIEGETESGAFGPLPAILEISLPQSGDPNPLLIALYMTAQTEAELGNGSIFWQSFTAGHPKQDEHFSQVTVSSSQVQMQVNLSDDNLRSDVMWFTQITGALADTISEAGGSIRSGVVPTAGTMTFTVQDNQVSGEIQLSGTTDLGVPSNYQAHFSSQ